MDRKLFLAVLDTSAITIDNTAVAAQLTTEDQPCTPMAIQKRLQKLKTMVKAGSVPLPVTRSRSLTFAHQHPRRR